MSRKGVRTVLIGLGRIAFELERDRLRYHPCTHAGSLLHFNKTLTERTRARRGFDLVGVCDIRPEQLKSFQRWWRGTNTSPGLPGKAGPDTPETCADYRDVLKLAPDLVIIATSVESHAAIAKAAMRAGAKAILLEKPIGHDAKQARSLLQLAAKTGCRVWVNFERRYHPAYRLARRYTQEKKFGELRHIGGRVLTGTMAALPGKTADYLEGPLLHDGVHWIDLLLWIAGRPRTFAADVDLSTREDRPDIEDTVRLRCDYGDFAAYLESGGRRRYFEFTLELDFSEGRIIAGNAGHFYFRAAASGRYAKFRELKPIKANWRPANPWLELYREINTELTKHPAIETEQLDAANERISANLSDAVTGMEIIDACYRGALRRRKK